MKGFKNVKAYIEGQGIITTCVGIENGKIAYIGNDQNVITEVIPFKDDCVLLPGFIDQHIHGAAGADKSVLRFSKKMRKSSPMWEHFISFIIIDTY